MDREHRAAASGEPDSLAFETEGGDADDGWQEFAERRRRGGRRSWLLVSAVVAVGGLLAALVISGGGADKATEPTKPPPIPSIATSTSPPPASAPSSTVAAAPFRTVGLGPVVGTPVGRRLVGVTRRGRDWFLVDVDLDLGDSVQTPVPGLTAPDEFGAGLIPVTGGALIYSQPGPAVIATNDGDLRHIGTDYPQTIYPGPDSSSAWWIDYGSGRPPLLLQVSLADSSVLASIPLDPNLQVIGTDGDGGVLMTMLGGPTWRVRPGGGIERLPAVKGTVLAAGHDLLVEQRCDDQLRCDVVAHQRDREDGVHFDIAATPFSTGAVSPDGRSVALWTIGADTTRVNLTALDLSTGGTTDLVSSADAPVVPTAVAWASPETLVFKKGDGLFYVRLDEPGSSPEPILVNGEALELELFGIGPKG